MRSEPRLSLVLSFPISLLILLLVVPWRITWVVYIRLPFPSFSSLPCLGVKIPSFCFLAYRPWAVILCRGSASVSLSVCLSVVPISVTVCCIFLSVRYIYVYVPPIGVVFYSVPTLCRLFFGISFKIWTLCFMFFIKIWSVRTYSWYSFLSGNTICLIFVGPLLYWPNRLQFLVA